MTVGRNINQFLSLPWQQPVSLWGPLICRKNLVMFWGKTGVGKSRLVWPLGYTLAAGGQFLNHFCPAPVRVGLFDTENTDDAIARRLTAIEQAAAFKPRGDHFRILTKDDCGGVPWNISSWEGQDKLNEFAKDLDVLIIDNVLGCCLPLDRHDDDVRQWQRVTPWLFSLRDAGKAVILVHHSGKSGQAQLGTSLRENWLDTIVEIRPPENFVPINGTEFELHFNKTRDVKRIDAQPLHVQYLEYDGVSNFVWSPLQSSKEQIVRSLKAEGLTRREVAKQTGFSLFDVKRVWDQDEEENSERPLGS